MLIVLFTYSFFGLLVLSTNERCLLKSITMYRDWFILVVLKIHPLYILRLYNYILLYVYFFYLPWELKFIFYLCEVTALSLEILSYSVWWQWSCTCFLSAGICIANYSWLEDYFVLAIVVLTPPVMRIFTTTEFKISHMATISKELFFFSC